ncbi:MAG: ABC transporter permease [Clostridia bacterium]|nr:ABC transporter permease [Clostridia bacterium]
MRAILKMTVRTIRTFFTRFLAILLIVALSAGFFAGLKITTDAMLNTGNNYLTDQHFYDFRLFSTIGFDKEDVGRFTEINGIESAEGTCSVDALVHFEDTVSPYKIHALTDDINLVSVKAGRMPTAANECLGDVDRYTEEDIGKTFTIVGENEDSVKEQLSGTEFTLVGLCNSPLYLGLDRGTTSIGSGTVSTFLYVPAEAFTSEVYTEVNLTLTDHAEIYSEEYDNLIETHEDAVTELAEKLTDERWERILAENHLTPELAESMGMEAPEVYVLTRAENAGYVSFENDTGIIGGVANIFPIFFIAISVLVCITTMSRMVDEERTQIGVLKAMGFGNSAIMGKYLLYAGSATVFGWGIGFFLCTWALPKIFWLAYNEIYNFVPITYLFSGSLAWITLAISLVSILGTTYVSCRKELTDVPASLIRPRAGKVGKRVILEHIKPIWNRLSFLRKITVRNMLLYKQRMFMMLIGIGCCAGLLVTAFGVRDSMIDVGEIQYTEIQKYELEASFEEEDADFVKAELKKIPGIDRFHPARLDYVDLRGEASMSSVHMLSYTDAELFTEYWCLQKFGEPLVMPGQGEALISPKVAEKLSLAVGDSFEVRNADMESGMVTVAGIFDNHIHDYVVLSSKTYVNLFGEWASNTVLIAADGDAEEIAKQLTELEHVTGVTQLQTMRSNITGALDCLNYIIWLIVFFSGALAFIVIFNLTNINIAERRREIATVQVLGFYPKETESYVLKENLILSVIASILGLPLGKLFHLAVMSMVKIDLITFNNTIKPVSYLIAFVFSVLFAVIVNHFMKRQIGKVNMAESLKAVE